MAKEWLAFQEVVDTGKTKVWVVLNAENNSFLGEVRWNGGWRQYVFVTSADGPCIWNPDCLDQLTAFIRGQMELRADKRKAEKIADTELATGRVVETVRIETDELDVIH